MFKAKFLAIFSASLVGLLTAVSAFNITELCALAPNSLVLQPNSCTKWFKCPSFPGAAEIEEGSCVFGLYFNKNTGKCEYKENVACPFEKTAVTENRCTRETDGLFLADNEHCNAYIYCNDGEEVRSYCPHNLVFDAKNKACVYKHQYKCPDSKEKADHDLKCLCLKDGALLADKNDCTKYSQCRKGVLETHSCNSSFAWNYVERRCMPVNEVDCYPSAKKPEPELKVCIDRMGPISDNISCSGYYFCRKMLNDTHDRKPQHFNCAPGSFFDSNTLSCRDRLNVKCSLDRCEGMGNKYVNIAGSCKAYALCASGVAKAQDVCGNNLYFDERSQSCIQQIVSYAACSV